MDIRAGLPFLLSPSRAISRGQLKGHVPDPVRLSPGSRERRFSRVTADGKMAGLFGKRGSARPRQRCVR